jgi:hypothetical protein
MTFPDDGGGGKRRPWGDDNEVRGGSVLFSVAIDIGDIEEKRGDPESGLKEKVAMTTLISGVPRDTMCSCFLIAGMHPIPSRHGEKARGSLQMKLVGGENYTEDQPTFGRGLLVYPRLIRGQTERALEIHLIFLNIHLRNRFHSECKREMSSPIRLYVP